MNLYEYNSYQSIIKVYIEEQKSLGDPLTYQDLANSLRMQKSYLSKIMAKNASLNKDQVYLLAQKMELKPSEKEYLFLLIDYERSAINEYRSELEEKIKKLQNNNTQSDKYLDKVVTSELTSSQMQRYYLLPEIQLIHLALAIPKYQNNPESLRIDFRLNKQIFKQSIKILDELKLIRVSKNKFELLKSNIHLKPDSPFFHQWQTQLKLKGIEWSKGLEDKDKYGFVASFTASESDKEEVRLEFLKFLKKVEKIVKKSESENLYQLNFDLFKWT